MPRLPRIVEPGVFYHVFTRGNRKGDIVVDDLDRRRFLTVVGAVVACRGWSCIAYCLMRNHYHLLLETPDGDLSDGMRALNGRYAQAFNKRHELGGHLFEKRFSAVPAESQWHLLELCRYIVLNPVRARICDHPADWPWSSYRAAVGLAAPERFLDVGRLLSYFGASEAKARVAFQLFVEDGIDRARAA